MKYKIHLGPLLRDARIKKKMSQVELSKHLGCTSQFICNWERGASYPPIKALQIIKDILQIPQERLLEVLVKDSKIPFKKIFKK